MMLHDLLREAAQTRPEVPLVLHAGMRASYGEIDLASGRLARLLAGCGVRRGDRVGLLVPNSARYVAAYFAVLKAGAVAVPLHAGQVARSLAETLNDCSAVALVSAAGPPLQACVEAAARVPSLRALVLPPGTTAPALPSRVRAATDDEAATLPTDLAVPGASDLDPAVIVYTSGSTGRPRGAVLRHANVLANTRSIVRYLELSARDRVVVVLPFPYVYGASLLHTHVAVGGSLVLHDSMVFPNTVLDAIEREEATGFAGVPSTYAILLHRSDLAARELPSLRYVTQAGGPMPVPHLRRLQEALPRTRIVVMYGATEASARLTWLPPERLADKIGSIGVPIPDVEVRVLRDDGSEAGVDEVGELVARGANVMQGYWEDPAATAEVLDAHGFHTGDLGRRDADGFLWVVGRKREMIKAGAHRISPREIEEALLAHPGVEEAAAVGRPDEVLGEVVVAHVTARPGASLEAEALLALCRELLPAHKVPAEVVVRAGMPRNAAGKIDKLALRAGAAPAAKGSA